MINKIQVRIATPIAEVSSFPSSDDYKNYVEDRAKKMLAGSELLNYAERTYREEDRYAYHTYSVNVVPFSESLNQMLSRAYVEGMQCAANIIEKSAWMNSTALHKTVLGKSHERNPYDS